MKRISLYKASQIYDEIRFHKKLGFYVWVFIHDDTVKVGYNNRFGVSSFIKNNEPRFLAISEYKTSILLEDYYKKDAAKMIQVLVNNAIDEYLHVKKNSYIFKKM